MPPEYVTIASVNQEVLLDSRNFELNQVSDTFEATKDGYFDDCSWLSRIFHEGIVAAVEQRYPSEDDVPAELENFVGVLEDLIDEVKLMDLMVCVISVAFFPSVDWPFLGRIDSRGGDTNHFGHRKHFNEEPSRNHPSVLDSRIRVRVECYARLNIVIEAEIRLSALQLVKSDKRPTHNLAETLSLNWSRFSKLWITPDGLSNPAVTQVSIEEPLTVSLSGELIHLERESTPATEQLVTLLKETGKIAVTISRHKHKVYSIILRAQEICNYILSLGERPEDQQPSDAGGLLRVLDEYSDLIEALEGYG
ncbi:hypothetical protein FRC00_008209 [Tulasnella sp. 408]|nr:hypothetical protein FRC00_008209 [Tulasnella sp. 408]